eukprot:5964798-Alexandrium_andersonii.AAC.1
MEVAHVWERGGGRQVPNTFPARRGAKGGSRAATREGAVGPPRRQKGKLRHEEVADLRGRPRKCTSPPAVGNPCFHLPAVLRPRTRLRVPPPGAPRAVVPRWR